MSAFAILLASVLGTHDVGGIVRADRVVLRSHDILLSDAASLTDQANGSLIVARIPAGRDGVILSRAAIASLVRRAVPTFRIDRPASGSITFVVPPSAVAKRSGGRCGALTSPVAKGSVIDGNSIRSVPCGTLRAAPLSFDREASLPRAEADLIAGSYLGPISARANPGLKKGEAATLVSTVGPVRIVREVTAMQTSRGRRVFVRDGDGQIFSVRQSALAK